MTRSPVAMTALVLLAAAWSAPPAWAADADRTRNYRKRPRGRSPRWTASARRPRRGWPSGSSTTPRGRRSKLCGAAPAAPRDTCSTCWRPRLPRAIRRPRSLVAICSQPRSEIALPDVAWLADEKTAAFERSNLRLLYGRWLVSEALYDEAAGTARRI